MLGKLFVILDSLRLIIGGNMVRFLKLGALALLVCFLGASDLQAQSLFGGGMSNGPIIGGGTGYCADDPNLGYCLENDCSGGGNCGQSRNNCQPRSKFVVERGGRRVLTYIGTRAGFERRFPQYAGRVASPVRNGRAGSRPTPAASRNYNDDVWVRSGITPRVPPTAPADSPGADSETEKPADTPPTPDSGESSPSDVEDTRP